MRPGPDDQSLKGQRPELIGLAVENPAGFAHLQQITSDRSSHQLLFVEA